MDGLAVELSASLDISRAVVENEGWLLGCCVVLLCLSMCRENSLTVSLSESSTPWEYSRCNAELELVLCCCN